MVAFIFSAALLCHGIQRNQRKKFELRSATCCLVVKFICVNPHNEYISILNVGYLLTFSRFFFLPTHLTSCHNVSFCLSHSGPSKCSSVVCCVFFFTSFARSRASTHSRFFYYNGRRHFPRSQNPNENCFTCSTHIYSLRLPFFFSGGVVFSPSFIYIFSSLLPIWSFAY